MLHYTDLWPCCSMWLKVILIRTRIYWQVSIIQGNQILVEPVEDLCEEVEQWEVSVIWGMRWTQVVFVRQLWQREQELSRWSLRNAGMGMFWEEYWSLKWRARGSEDDQRRRGRCKWRRRARVLVWRRRMP